LLKTQNEIQYVTNHSGDEDRKSAQKCNILFVRVLVGINICSANIDEISLKTTNLDDVEEAIEFE